MDSTSFLHRNAFCTRSLRVSDRSGSVGAYPAPYPGMPGFATATPSQWNNDSHAGGQRDTPPCSQQLPNQSNGRGGEGGGGGTSNYSSGQSAPTGQSDELCVPSSVGLLCSFSPYRGLTFPQELTCFECGAYRQHYAHECPERFVRVRLEPPQGRRIDSGGGGITKDSSAWHPSRSFAC